MLTPSRGVLMQTIIVLEDDAINRQAIGAILRYVGYKVLEAARGADAISLCKNRAAPVDLLVTDINLADRSGTDVALEAVKSCPELPVLLISALPLSGWRRADLFNFKRLQSRVVAFLEKPFHASTLADTVRRLLAGDHDLRPHVV